MKTLSRHLRKRIEAEEWANAMRELQASRESDHDFLSSPESLSWCRRLWVEEIGAIFLAVTTSAIAIIANYILFIRVLHVQF